MVEEGDDDEDPQDINIPNFEGERQVNGLELDFSTMDYTNPIKTCKLNIDIKENPKFIVIEDY